MRTESQVGDGGSRGTVGGRARREQIERAAAEVLAEMGYAATSVGRIAERAGVSKGVVTYHFPSKDELLRQVALRLFQECSAHIAASISGARTPVERLSAGLNAELDFFSTRRIEFLAMAEIMANHRDASFGHAFDDVANSETGALMDVLGEGQAQGEFRAFDVYEVAHLISAAKNGLLDRWATNESLDLRAASAKLMDFIQSAVSER